MQVAIALYEGVDALDAIGPYAVVSRLPGGGDRLCRGRARATARLERARARRRGDPLRGPQPDVLVVPGGPGSRSSAGAEIIEWIRTAHASTRWTTSVCTGRLASDRRGRRARRGAGDLALLHLDRLREPAPNHRRAGGPRGQGDHRGRCVVGHRHGAASGRARGRKRRSAGDPARDRVRPQPPFDAGSPIKAPEHVVELVKAAAPRVREADGAPQRPATSATYAATASISSSLSRSA